MIGQHRESAAILSQTRVSDNLKRLACGSRKTKGFSRSQTPLKWNFSKIRCTDEFREEASFSPFAGNRLPRTLSVLYFPFPDATPGTVKLGRKTASQVESTSGTTEAATVDNKTSNQNVEWFYSVGARKMGPDPRRFRIGTHAGSGAAIPAPKPADRNRI